nr:ribonuclease Sa3 [Streptomyces lavendulae subsp. lavendulae]
MRIPPRLVALAGAAASPPPSSRDPSPPRLPPPTPCSLLRRLRIGEGGGQGLLLGLPSQAHDTLDLIDEGGPFPYPRTASSSRTARACCPPTARVLPRVHRHHPRLAHARRPPDITGQQWQEDYYTADHYASFRGSTSPADPGSAPHPRRRPPPVRGGTAASSVRRGRYEGWRRRGCCPRDR